LIVDEKCDLERSSLRYGVEGEEVKGELDLNSLPPFLSLFRRDEFESEAEVTGSAL